MTAREDAGQALPELIETEAELEEILSRPTEPVVQAVSELEGDILILGVGGKIGPTLASMVKRASSEAGADKRVIGLDYQFADDVRERLEAAGIETQTADLTDPAQVRDLPEVENVIFMAGMKFGATGAEALVWALNVYMPALVADRFANSRIAVFSSGNIYGFTPVAAGGSTESSEVRPDGDYAQSILGRERMFEHFSNKHGNPVTLVRLNYAIDLRYGILLDVGQQVYAQQPVDVTMGHVNVIWQGDVNAQVIRCLTLAEAPPRIINITGPETVPIRYVATRFAELFGVEPIIEGVESDTALLSNSAEAAGVFGYPRVPLDRMIRWVAHWIEIEGPTLAKPTHYETRDGKF